MMWPLGWFTKHKPSPDPRTIPEWLRDIDPVAIGRQRFDAIMEARASQPHLAESMLVEVSKHWRRLGTAKKFGTDGFGP